MASLGHHANSDDVLQRTNLTLWRKANDFRPDADFMPWAITIARFEVLAFLRDHGRDRLVFDPDVMELVGCEVNEKLDSMTQRQQALRECMDKLSTENRDLLRQKYIHQQSISQISISTQRSMDSVKSLMLRIRRRLAECVERHLQEASD